MICADSEAYCVYSLHRTRVCLLDKASGRSSWTFVRAHVIMLIEMRRGLDYRLMALVATFDVLAGDSGGLHLFSVLISDKACGRCS